MVLAKAPRTIQYKKVWQEGLRGLPKELVKKKPFCDCRVKTTALALGKCSLSDPESQCSMAVSQVTLCGRGILLLRFFSMCVFGGFVTSTHVEVKGPGIQTQHQGLYHEPSYCLG